MLRRLQDIAFDLEKPIGPDNPLGQVIVNTHSPAVVGQVPDDSILLAEPEEWMREGARIGTVRLRWLEDTWRSRAESDVPALAKGKLLSYLNPISPVDSFEPALKEFRKEGSDA